MRHIRISALSWRFGATQRLGLLSENKPHEVTHRCQKSIHGTTEGDVCLDNALWYKYYDSGRDDFVGNFGVNDEVANLLTYKLPE